MTRDKRASNCAWAIPTILADAPAWLDGEHRAWTCRRTSPPTPLESTEVCGDCPFWQGRPSTVEADHENWADRVGAPLLIDVIARRL
jgi:hypothetical protein